MVCTESVLVKELSCVQCMLVSGGKTASNKFAITKGGLQEQDYRRGFKGLLMVDAGLKWTSTVALGQVSYATPCLQHHTGVAQT